MNMLKIGNIQERIIMKDKLKEIIEECLDSCTENDLQTICETLEKIGFDTKRNSPK